jgi:hypothetical protein
MSDEQGVLRELRAFVVDTAPAAWVRGISRWW